MERSRTTIELDKTARDDVSRARALIEMDTGERLSLGAVVSRLAGAWLANRDRPLQASTRATH